VPRAALAADDIAAFRRRAAGAAMHLFAERGHDAVTMRSVAAALGVSAMTPYRYLAGMDELFALVRAEAFRRFADRLEAALARKGDPIARLLRLKRAYVKFAIDEPDAYRIMFEVRSPAAAAEPPEVARESRRAFGCLHRTVADAVAAGQLVGDPLTLAHLAWASSHGLVSLHLAGRLGIGRSLAQLAAIDHELSAVRHVGAPARPRKQTRTPRRSPR
jgi:AcrR family transcriptional regulator